MKLNRGKMLLIFKILFLNAFVLFVDGSVQNVPPDWNLAFDPNLVQNVLDSKECERQLAYIRNNATSIRTRFMDASWRFPRSILKGNTRDLGNYLQCLDINEEAPNMNIEGKYCMSRVSISIDGSVLPNVPDGTWRNSDIGSRDPNPWLELPWKELRATAMVTVHGGMKEKIAIYDILRNTFLKQIGVAEKTSARNSLSMTYNLAMCIPKVCTTQEALSSLTRNLSGSLEITDDFCRLNNDKPWVPVDTVAMVVISVIGLLLITSTSYDIWQSLIQKKEPKQVNKLYQSFSIYTNTKIFFTFPSGPKVVNCLEGVRSIAMLWVLVGHVFQTQIVNIENMLDAVDFIFSLSGVWIVSAHITVDTFFLLSGILVVYTAASKLTPRSLLKNLHLFYLNRLLRMFPVLAFSILVTASFLHRLFDGPNFHQFQSWVNECRATWWVTLLYVQNWASPDGFCFGHTWYLAIDMQLYILCPLVLYWVLGKNKILPWIALTSTFFAVLVASTVYNFLNDFQSGMVAPRPLEENLRYMQKYYYNTLTRAGPFIVGMITGYFLHIYREKKIEISRVTCVCLWVVALGCTTTGFIYNYWTAQMDWDNQIMDNLINSYIRVIWAIGVAWIVFACHNGYGGPANWFLSLYVFKILGRLSYAIYIVHFPLMYLSLAIRVSQVYFNTTFSMYRFMSEFWIAFFAAFLITILIDIPFTNLIKMGLEGRRRAPVSSKKEDVTNFKTQS